MLLDILILDQDAAFVLHVAGGAARALVIVAVILNGETSGWDDPVPADGHLLGVVARPDLNLVDIVVGETVLEHGIIEVLRVLIVVVVALEEAGFTTN